MEEAPGADRGGLRRPGHRFFFKPGGVEPLGGGYLWQGSEMSSWATTGSAWR